MVLWELITLKRPWDNSEAEELGSLEDMWVPELDSANDQPLVQQQRITEYAIIQARVSDVSVVAADFRFAIDVWSVRIFPGRFVRPFGLAIWRV